MDKITLVVGSTRTGSFNQQLADVVRETVGDRAAVAQLDYTDVPFMNQDIEWPTPTPWPACAASWPPPTASGS